MAAGVKDENTCFTEILKDIVLFLFNSSKAEEGRSFSISSKYLKFKVLFAIRAKTDSPDPLDI